MNHLSAAVAGVVAIFFVSILDAPCALANVRSTASARAPGFAFPQPANQPVPPQIFDPLDTFPNEGWSSLTPMPSGRWAHAMASYSTGVYPANGAFVYVIAGNDASFASTSEVSRYDVTADSWSDVAPMTPTRSQISAARIGGRIFVPGGYASGFSPVTTLSIYDITLDQWTTGAPLPQATGDYAIGVYADRYIYVIGGYSGSGDLNTVQVYDSMADSWQSATVKPGSAAAGLRGGIVGNHIIVAGGYSQSAAAELADAFVGTIDAIDPTLIAWAPAPPYAGGPAGRLGAGAPFAAGPAQGVNALNFVLFTGGDPNGAGTAVKNDTWLYDFNDGTWKSGPVKPTGVSNIDNIVGVASGGKLRMASTGGYNGSVVVSVNEWLTFGDETPPDLALTMSDGGATLDPGGTVVYTLNYTATGGGSAPNVTITDTIPPGTTFNATGSTAGWACTPDATANSVCVFSLGTLAGGATGSLLFALDSVFPLPPSVTNSADISTVATFGAEQNLSNNGDSETTPFTTGSVGITPGGVLVTGEDGTSAQFQVVLLVAPTADVTIDFVSDDPTEGIAAPAQLIFTTTDWNVPQTVTVTGVSDFDADGDVAYSVIGTLTSSGNYNGVIVPTVSLINLDGPSDRIFADGFEE